MKDELEHIAKLLHATYHGNAWHGPAVKQVLTGITASQSQLRIPEAHSIIELVGHLTAWRTFVIHKLLGDTDYTVAESANFPAGFTWDQTLDSLEKSQSELQDAITKFDGSRLHDLVPHKGYKYTFYGLLHGIIHHDLYHIGQIALAKKQTI
jgi:uncharacterized damage-inducible protein DinB